MAERARTGVVFILVVFTLLVCPGSAEEEGEDVKCGKPNAWMNPGIPISKVNEPEGDHRCPVRGIVEEITWVCKERYCCDAECNCTSTLYEQSSSCPPSSNATKLECYVKHKHMRFFRYVCCKDFYWDNATNLCLDPLATTTTTTSAPNTSEDLVTVGEAAAVVKYVAVPYPVYIWVPVGLLVLLLLGIIFLLLWCRKCKKKQAPPPIGHENPAFENHGYEVPTGGAVGPAPLPVKLPFVGDDEKKGIPDEEFGMAVGGDLPPAYIDKEKKGMAEENEYADIDEMKSMSLMHEKDDEYVAPSDLLPRLPPSYSHVPHGYLDPPAYQPPERTSAGHQANRLSYNFADQDNLMNEAHEDLRN